MVETPKTEKVGETSFGKLVDSVPPDSNYEMMTKELEHPLKGTNILPMGEIAYVLIVTIPADGKTVHKRGNQLTKCHPASEDGMAHKGEVPGVDR